jgi:DNA-binding MarR family transcriptional regulator
LAALDRTAATTEPDLLPFTLNRLMAGWNARLAARLADRGIGFPQWRVLMVASRADQPLSIIELSERTLVPHSTLSRQIGAMERDGLVKRVTSQTDARAVRLVLTARGRARYQEALPIALAEAEAGLTTLTKSEVAELQRLLSRISDALGLPAG